MTLRKINEAHHATCRFTDLYFERLIMRIKKIHLAIFFCLFQLNAATYADRHGYEQDDDHDGYEHDECRSSRGSCNSLASAQSSYPSSSRSGSGYEHGTREGCSEDGDDSHGSNHQESNHNSACAAPVQTSAAAPSSISSRIADSSSRFESSYLEESSNDDQSSHYKHSNDGGSGGAD